MPLQHLSRFALELNVQTLVSCWPIRWLHLHSVPCCSILIPRCSSTPLSLWTTMLPRCVDQRASILHMWSVSSLGNWQRQRQRVHRSARCSLLVAVGTPSTWRVEWVVQYVSDELCPHVLLSRLHSLQANSMSGRSDARYASLADTPHVAGLLPIRF